MAEFERAEEIKRFKDNLTKNAEDLIFSVIPNKIIELNSLLETPQFSNVNVPNCHRDLNIATHVLNSFDTKERAVGEKSKELIKCAVNQGPVPINDTVSDLVDIVKPYVRELIKYVKEIELWIALLVPKIEDGNNFGVEVQQNALIDVHLVGIQSLKKLLQIPEYFTTRAKTLQKVFEFPFIKDYQQAIQECDELAFFRLKRVLSDTRNNYCILHDIITKNLEKIKKPRSTAFFEDLY